MVEFNLLNSTILLFIHPQKIEKKSQYFFAKA